MSELYYCKMQNIMRLPKLNNALVWGEYSQVYNKCCLITKFFLPTTNYFLNCSREREPEKPKHKAALIRTH